MFRSSKELMGYRLLATDGLIGRCKDMLFDDLQWTVRYIVVDTGNWLAGRKVIVSAAQLKEPDWNEKAIPVSLTVKQIEDAPPLESNAPISRRYERLWLERFGQPQYWVPLGPVGTPIVANVAAMHKETRKELKTTADAGKESTNLRSMEEVSDYHIRATDGDIDHVEEFIIDDTTWSLRYLVVDTRRLIPGGKVLLSHEWLRSVSWPEREVWRFTRTSNEHIRLSIGPDQ